MDENAEDILAGDDVGSRDPAHEDTEQQKIAGQIRRTLAHTTRKKLGTPQKEMLWEQIVLATDHTAMAGRRKRRAYSWIAAAAVLVIGGAAWLFSQMNTATQPTALEQFAKQNLANLQHGDSVRMVSSAGNTVGIANDAVLHYQDSTIRLTTAMGAEEAITLDNSDRYYSLAVPYGKRSEIVLADGTKVWLNAGSQLTFPKKFDGSARAVYLEGEAFFDVVSHASQPFVVHVNDLDINVLGTTFNLSSYADDDFCSVTLLSGAVALQSKETDGFGVSQLRPGQKATYNRGGRKLVFSAASGDDDISWTTRKLTLTSNPMGGVIRKLERIYNAEIDYPADNTGNVDRFSGSLDLNQSLLDILTFLYEPNEYKFKQTGRRFSVTPK